MSRGSIASIADPAWRQDHPLPPIGGGLDKEARGRVLLVAGSALVPGAPRLTAEAALRAGAGKVQIGTVAAHAAMLGMLMPEAAVVALPVDADGQIAEGAAAILAPMAARCDVLVLGPGMQAQTHSCHLVLSLIEASHEECALVLDAGAMTATHDNAKAIKSCRRRLVMTPHHGELAVLLDKAETAISRDPPRAAIEAARNFGATIVLKSAETVIVTPTGEMFGYASDAAGLGTAGSGDVLAGVIGGLLARGADPVTASGWGVWLHGQAGSAAALRVGPLGFLARELLPELPALMAAQAQR